MDCGQKLCWETWETEIVLQITETMIQLYNKITNIKKVLKLTDNLANTHQLRQKLQQHSEVPDNDIEAYVPYFNIKDDVDDPEDTRFLAIFATKRTLSLLSESDILRLHS